MEQIDMAHAEVQSLGVYKFVLNWLSIMWLKKVRYQPPAGFEVGFLFIVDSVLPSTELIARRRWLSALTEFKQAFHVGPGVVPCRSILVE